MMSHGESQGLNTQLTLYRIIWLALLISVPFYVRLAFKLSPIYLTNDFLSTLPELREPIEATFALVGVVAAFLALFLPRVVQSRLAAFLLRLVLLESVTLLGLVLSKLVSNPVRVIPFALVSVLGYLASFPTRKWAESSRLRVEA
jgi:hypothetical protein